MKHIDYMDVAKTVMTQLNQGAFLTVKAGDQLNTMTIGWATMGIIWSKPIVMVAVRDSRYTFEIIEKAVDFTISFPKNDMSKELSYCGSASGRSFDKFKECKLKPGAAQKTVSPIIQIPGIHFECKIVYKTAMDPAFLDKTYKKLYPQSDFHTLYFGELVSCYEI
ncbi:MAG: flavin reductase family protein [Anaerolineales bacterium]|nr:flavin reductase family protein [Anaerolineales bacterium]